MKLRTLLLPLMVLALLAAACGDDSGGDGTTATPATPATTATTAVATPDETPDETSDETPDAEPFVIALPVSQTGGNAQVGQELLLGLQLWMDMVNNNTGLYADRTEEPGLLGRQVVLQFDDDQSKSDEAGKLVTKYITQDNADIVLPPYGSGATGVVAPIFKQYNYALIGSSAAAESIYKTGLDNMVMAISPTSKWLEEVPGLVEDAGYETVSMVTLDNPATLDSKDRLETQFADIGVEVSGDELYSWGNADFSAIWTNVKNQDPDVVVLYAFGGDAVTAMRQAAEQQVSPKMWIVFAGAWRNDVFVEGVGAEIADCVIGDQQWSRSWMTTGAAEFAEAYTASVGSDPLQGAAGADGSAAWGFVAGQLLTEAIDHLGEAALEDQQTIVDYLKSGAVTETAIGFFAADPETGINTATTPVLFQFQDGERVTIAPGDLKDGDVILPCGPKG
jgi:branched-chain amino acid transport system substrate-binding protein